MSDLLHDPAVSTVLAVVTPEEMPVVETIELRTRLSQATPIDFAGVIVNRMPDSIVDSSVLAAARADASLGMTSEVAEWLVARREAAETHAKRLADAFELGNIETIAEARATGQPAMSPVVTTDHVVGELQRILREHQ